MNTARKTTKLFALAIVALLLTISRGTQAQDKDRDFKMQEKALSKLATELSGVRFNDALADSLSKSLNLLFDQTINTEGSFDYAFDSIFPIGKIETKDKNVRIFTWSYVKSNGAVEHFGYIQHYFKPKKQVLTFQLQDSSNAIVQAESQSLNHKKWFGALYYEIVETEINSGKLYTLIGFDANNIYSTKKVIETMYFTSSGKPKFGKSIIKIGRKKHKRIIYEYSRMASMLIKWDPNMEMIVADHLSPINNAYLGNFRFYGPDLSYDGFKFENGNWVFYSDIDYKKENGRQRRNAR